MSVFLDDTLTDANSTALENHDPDIGDPDSWERVGFHIPRGDGESSNSATIQSNELRSGGTGHAYRNATAPASPEYDVECAKLHFLAGINLASSRTSGFLLARMSPTGTAEADVDCYIAGHSGDSSWRTSGWAIAKLVSGSYTILSGSGDQTHAVDDTDYALHLEVRDAEKVLTVNETVFSVSTTDNEITQTGRAGVNIAHAKEAVLLDGYTATDAGGGGPSPQTVSLSPALAQWSASAPTSAAGPVSRALSPAPGSWAAQALTPAAGAVTRDLTPAEGRWLASAPTVLPGPVTRELTPAAAAWTAQALSILTDDLVVQLAPATAQWQASALQLLAGAVTRSLTPAEASWTAQALATLTGTSVQLQPAVAQWLAGALETELGARAVALTSASAAWQASELAILRDGISTAITAAVAEWHVGELAVEIGLRAVQLVPAVASWEAAALEALTGDVAIALVPAVGRWEASVLVAIGGLTDARIIVVTSARRHFRLSSDPRSFRVTSPRRHFIIGD